MAHISGAESQCVPRNIEPAVLRPFFSPRNARCTRLLSDSAHEQMAPGTIGLNALQRRTAAVALNTMLPVTRFDVSPAEMTAVELNLTADLMVKNKQKPKLVRGRLLPSFMGGAGPGWRSWDACLACRGIDVPAHRVVVEMAPQFEPWATLWHPENAQIHCSEMCVVRGFTNSGLLP